VIQKVLFFPFPIHGERCRRRIGAEKVPKRCGELCPHTFDKLKPHLPVAEAPPISRFLLPPVLRMRFLSTRAQDVPKKVDLSCVETHASCVQSRFEELKGKGGVYDTKFPLSCHAGFTEREYRHLKERVPEYEV